MRLKENDEMGVMLRRWRRAEESVRGRTRASLRVALGCRLTHTAESSFRHSAVCVCADRGRETGREGESGVTEEERERESRRKGEQAPWKQLQQHKMEFVSSTIPALYLFHPSLWHSCFSSRHISFCIYSAPRSDYKQLWMWNEISVLFYIYFPSFRSETWDAGVVRHEWLSTIHNTFPLFR